MKKLVSMLLVLAMLVTVFAGLAVTASAADTVLSVYTQAGEAGEKTFAAVYTPADTANYAAARVALTVTVEPLLSGGAIAGIAIGCTVGALLIAYGALALCFKKGVVKGAFFARIYPFIK